MKRSLIVACVFVVTNVSAVLFTQPMPNFSGRWILDSAPVVGASRAATGTAAVGKPGDGQKLLTEVSGAAFNCSEGCVITQDKLALRMSRSVGPQGSKEAVFRLDGAPSTIPSNVSEKTYAATAKWSGLKLQIVRDMGPISVVQELALDGEKMVVTNKFSIEQDKLVTLVYRKQ